MAKYVDESVKEAGRRAAGKQASKMMDKKKTTKTVVTPGTKVSQATIDKIKSMGMSAALKSASSNNSPEYREGLRRLYGASRVEKATASTKPSSSGRYVGSMFVPDKAPAKAPSTAYSPAPMKARTSYSPTPYKAPGSKPKSTSKSPNGTLTPIQQAQQDAYRSQSGYKAPTAKTPAQITAAKKKAAAAAKRRADAARGRASSARTQ